MQLFALPDTVAYMSEAPHNVTSDSASPTTALQSQFLAHLSHEIRTPMTAVLGFSQMLLDTSLNPSQREMAQIIYTGTHALLTVVNDILDYSKTQSGMLALNSISFNVGDIVDDVNELLAPQAMSKSISLLSQVDVDVLSSQRGDPGRLRQVLTNLIGNAVKFTENGHVVTRVRQQEESERDVVLRISITDTGIGIPANRVHELFHPYVQADASISRAYGGSGLGLAISQQLVKLMGGDIRVLSIPGVGSTFWFTVRLEKPAADVPPLARNSVAALEGRRILVVEDQPAIRRTLVAQLESWKMKPSEALDWGNAKQQLRAGAASNSNFDFAIFSAPDSKNSAGLDPLRGGRLDGEFAGLNIVLLSSDLNSGLAYARRLDVATCLAKPVRKSSLFKALTAALAGQTTAPLAQQFG